MYLVFLELIFTEQLPFSYALCQALDTQILPHSVRFCYCLHFPLRKLRLREVTSLESWSQDTSFICALFVPAALQAGGYNSEKAQTPCPPGAGVAPRIDRQQIAT